MISCCSAVMTPSYLGNSGYFLRLSGCNDNPRTVGNLATSCGFLTVLAFSVTCLEPSATALSWIFWGFLG